MIRKTAILVGSLRKDSLNRKVAQALCSLAPESFHGEFIDIGSLPWYNEDLEAHPPSSWQTFREQIRACDGVLFITPEYNRSIPAALKNAIDVGSRPYGHSVWNNKPAAVISVSPGAIGGFGAHHHLRQSLSCLNMPLLPAPEAYIGMANTLFNAQGALIKEDSRQFLIQFLSAWMTWLNDRCIAEI